MLMNQVLAKQMKCPPIDQRDQLTDLPRFNSEHTLVTLFEHLLDLHIDSRNTGLLREFDCSNGIADIVLFELHNHWEESIGLKDIPPRWAYWLHSLPFPECFKTDDARQIAGVTRRQAISFLKLVVDLGFCEGTGGRDEWRVVMQPNPIVERFYAIEAKLRDWKRALSQAARYQDYAVQSWVLLDEHAIRPALDNVELFEHLNIGLAAISQSARPTAYFVPHIAMPKSNLRYWQANAETARRLALDTKE